MSWENMVHMGWTYYFLIFYADDYQDNASQSPLEGILMFVRKQIEPTENRDSYYLGFLIFVCSYSK